MPEARGNGRHEPPADPFDDRISRPVVEHRQLPARVRGRALTELNVLRGREAVPSQFHSGLRRCRCANQECRDYRSRGALISDHAVSSASLKPAEMAPKHAQFRSAHSRGALTPAQHVTTGMHLARLTFGEACNECEGNTRNGSDRRMCRMQRHDEQQSAIDYARRHERQLERDSVDRANAGRERTPWTPAGWSGARRSASGDAELRDVDTRAALRSDDSRRPDAGGSCSHTGGIDRPRGGAQR